MKTQNKILLSATFLLLGKVVTLLRDLNFFEESPRASNDDECYRIRSIGASEDQTRFDANSVFVTNWMILKYDPTEADRPGKIRVVSGFQKTDHQFKKSTKDFVDNDLTIRELPMKGFPEGNYFHPHGMYYREQEHQLYVINHAYAKGGERIEVFDVEIDVQYDVYDDDGDSEDGTNIPIGLTYKHSITSDWMKEELNGILNSLVVVEPNKFYVTQYESHAQAFSDEAWFSLDTKYKIHLANLIIFRPREAKVWYCDYSTDSLDCRIVADGFVMANGITATTPDYSQVFVTDYYGKEISILDRNKSTNDLTINTVLPTVAHIDNLKFDPDSGRVYGGGVTNFFWSIVNGAFYYPQEVDTSTSGTFELSKEESSNSWTLREVLSTSKLNFGTNSVRINDYYVMGAGGLGLPGLLFCPVLADPQTTDASSTTAEEL